MLQNVLFLIDVINRCGDGRIDGTSADYGDVLVTMVMFIHVLIFKNVMVAMIAHLIWWSKSKCASECFVSHRCYQSLW